MFIRAPGIYDDANTPLPEFNKYWKQCIHAPQGYKWALDMDEYLHHIWFKTLDSETKTKLTSDLISIYGKDPIMQELVKSYAEKQTLQPTELFSYYCTETSDPLLTPYIVSECNKYINRGTLQLTR